MQRVVIIGCPGSGKSTFARRLQRYTGLPLVYLDMLWHLPDHTTRSRPEFDRALAQVLSQPRWIIDGNYTRTLPQRLARCDHVFLFDLPVCQCLVGAAGRVGQKRPDMPWVEQAFDPEFRQWITGFSTRQMPVVRQCLQPYIGRVPITRFTTRAQAEGYLPKR